MLTSISSQEMQDVVGGKFSLADSHYTGSVFALGEDARVLRAVVLQTLSLCHHSVTHHVVNVKQKLKTSKPDVTG